MADPRTNTETCHDTEAQARKACADYLLDYPAHIWATLVCLQGAKVKSGRDGDTPRTKTLMTRLTRPKTARPIHPDDR